MELLAPAGDFDKLKCAYHYGADAAYIGGKLFNLRAQSGNFTLDEIQKACELKNALGKKLFLTLNAFVQEDELEELRAFLNEIKGVDIDAFIVADPGVFSELKDIIPGAVVHVSTQANVTSSASAKFWKSLGAQRVVAARELSLEEIKKIKAESGMEVETFVHGAVCVAYAGRCLLSSYMTGRDANRGSCAQVCRWEFKLLEERSRPGEYFPVIEGDGYSSIFSSKDLMMAYHLDKLKEAGIDSLKIEGRMKSVYYTANVVRVYRKLLDGLNSLESGKSYSELLEEDEYREYLEELSLVSRRESGTGFFFGENSNSEDAKITFESYRRGRRLMAIVGLEPSEYSGYKKVKLYNTLYDNGEYILIAKGFAKKGLSSPELFADFGSGLERVDKLRNVDKQAYVRDDFEDLSIICAVDERETRGRS